MLVRLTDALFGLKAFYSSSGIGLFFPLKTGEMFESTKFSQFASLSLVSRCLEAQGTGEVQITKNSSCPGDPDKVRDRIKTGHSKAVERI